MSELIELLKDEFPHAFEVLNSQAVLEDLRRVLTGIALKDEEGLSHSRLFAEPKVLNFQLDKSVAGNLITQSIGTYLAENSANWPMNPWLSNKVWSITDEIEQSLAHKVVRSGKVDLIHWAKCLPKESLMLQDAVSCSVSMYLSKCQNIWISNSLWADIDLLRQEDIAGQSLGHYLASAHRSWSKTPESSQKNVLWIGATSYLGETVGEALVLASPDHFGRIYSSILKFGLPMKFTSQFFQRVQKHIGELELSNCITDSVFTVYESYLALGVSDNTEKVSWLAGFFSNLKFIPGEFRTTSCDELIQTVYDELAPLLKSRPATDIMYLAGDIVPVNWYEPAHDLLCVVEAANNFSLAVTDIDFNHESLKSCLY